MAITIEQTGALLDGFATFYPNFYKQAVSRNKTLMMWQMVLDQYDYELIQAACMDYIQTEHFPPVPADIISRIRAMLRSGEDTEAEAWALVVKAVSNSGYHSAEEFAKLPDAIKHCVGSPNQLREWALMDADTFQSVIGSNFRKAIKTEREREKYREAIPENVRPLISGLAGKLALEDGK